MRLASRFRQSRWLLLAAALAATGCGGSSDSDGLASKGANVGRTSLSPEVTELDAGAGAGAPTAWAVADLATAGALHPALSSKVALRTKASSTQSDQFFYADSADRVVVYRFYLKRRGGHFYTASVAERDAVIANLSAEYQYEGPAFTAYGSAHALMQPVYRFYNAQTGYHLYTASEDERTSILANLPQFAFEGVAYHVAKADHATLKPLYRFYDTALGYHFYTASEDERISLQSTRPELRYEGVAYRVFGSATVPWQGVGGSATAASGASSSEPFLQFSPGLDPTERTGLSQGRELFLARWTPAPGARATLDGLGPLFNADACSACHVENGLAPNLLAGGGIGRGMLFRLGNRSGAVSSVYGGQLQDRATAGLPEGSVTWRNLDSGAIEFALMVLGTPLENGMSLSPRLAPRLVGMGLLDMVPQSQILEFADAEDSDGNGISGRAHRLPDGSLGRFGWKAIHGDLRHQIAGALHQDMGLTTSLNAAENCTPHEPVCVTEANGGTPEVADESLENLTRFSTALSVPARRHDDLARFQRGAKLFTETGCAQCHRPVLRTGTSTAFPSLSNQLIYPYTDLLLHDMGSQLDEGVREVNAEAGEWRTPPLWGIGLVAQGANARFLHDGRATTIDQAVRWHGGEALSVRNRYVALDEATRETLLYFINGL